MTKPKTYGEFADTTPTVYVDIRVRDREITDDMWRVLNAENELSPDIVEQFNMGSDKHTYIDYYDDENVVLTTATAKESESDYTIAMFSGIVGARFEMRSSAMSGMNTTVRYRLWTSCSHRLRSSTKVVRRRINVLLG